jgi:hypothetical protein
LTTTSGGRRPTRTRPRAFPGGRRGHYHRLTLQLFLKAVGWLNSVPGRPLYEVVETREKDDVVGNGFVVVLRAVKGEP